MGFLYFFHFIPGFHVLFVICGVEIVISDLLHPPTPPPASPPPSFIPGLCREFEQVWILSGEICLVLFPSFLLIWLVLAVGLLRR